VLGDIGEERIVTSVDVTIFRPPPELADRTFLVQAFSTADWFRAVSDRSGGTTHKRISRGALGRLSINLPPVPEQSAIARVLSDMDAELSVLEARRDKTRNIKQAMMQELLTGKTRLV
jgi:type I restriction enzyme S subunit